MKVFKYSLPHLGTNVVSLPRGASPLTVGIQRDELVMWALCPPGEIVDERQFYVVWTGSSVPSGPVRYIGTATHDDSTVVHVFEELS